MTSALAETKELEALEHIMSDGSADPMKLSSGFLRMITETFVMKLVVVRSELFTREL